MHTCKCLCGDVEFEITANLKHAISCHCQYCRKSHAAPFVTVLVVLPQNFKINKGREKLERFPKDANKIGRYICQTCGSKLYTEAAENLPLSVHTSTLVNEKDVQVMAHTNTESKCPHYTIADTLPQFEGCLTKDDYLKLIS